MSALANHQTIAELIQSDLKAGEQIRFVVTSNSMQPVMRTGEFAIAEAVATDALQIGDILVVRRKDDFLTHRAIGRSKNSWLTKGDNNSLPDPPTTTRQIIGRVSAIEKAERTIQLREPQWVRVGSLIAKLGKLETKAFKIHRYFRYPFRRHTYRSEFSVDNVTQLPRVDILYACADMPKLEKCSLSWVDPRKIFKKCLPSLPFWE